MYRVTLCIKGVSTDIENLKIVNAARVAKWFSTIYKVPIKPMGLVGYIFTIGYYELRAPNGNDYISVHRIDPDYFQFKPGGGKGNVISR